LYVKASAGSGKTRVLTERIRVLLSRSNKKVLALTFTNKAGQEIKDRLADIEEIDQRAFVGTFHGFCQSVLENILGGSALSLFTICSAITGANLVFCDVIRSYKARLKPSSPV
jgi:DNA helicase-2/ATP-dependent DNA helicase PcrA